MEKLFKKSLLCVFLIIFSTFAATPSLGEAQTNTWSGSTIRIKTDGSIEPSNAPITTSDKITYILTSDVVITSGDGIVVERDDIILDGKNHSVTGPRRGTVAGVKLEKRRGVTIRNIIVKDFYYGIYLTMSHNNSIIASNTTLNYGYGIFLNGSTGNKITGNIISKAMFYGIYLTAFSNNNAILGNIFINCGLFVWDSYGNTVKDNIVNDKPLVYLEGKTGLTVTNAGQVILVRCKEIRVENLDISKVGVGVFLWETSNSVIAGNTISNVGGEGIYLVISSSNTITGNNVSYSDCGIKLSRSLNNTVTGNIISKNRFGIYLAQSSGNTITSNLVSNSGSNGIVLFYSSDNKIYHNDFITNAQQVGTVRSTNSWDDGSKGNFWSDYSGTDANNDGIMDKPYVIDPDNKDRYPLVNRYVNIYKVTVSSPYGLATGSGRYARGATVTISLSQTLVDHGNRTRNIFKGWYEGNSLVSDKQSFSITVDRLRNIIAAWDTEYEVTVSTPYSSATGSGWYARGGTATVSVSPTQVEKDFFTILVFEGWSIDGSIISTSPTYSFTVDNPVTLTANWRSEVKPLSIGLTAGVILALTAVVILMAKKRKPIPPPPPPPTI